MGEKKRTSTKMPSEEEESVGAAGGFAGEEKTEAPRRPAANRAERKTPAAWLSTAESDVGGPAFPIVGIGASAGGLEAMTEFFQNVPAGCGIAFVVVTHQHAGHTSLLPELLSRHTELRVLPASSGVRVEPNHVYVGPPGGQLAIIDRSLQFTKPKKPANVRLPIDCFFRSLAQDQWDLAICIVLSGTGTDGTLGVREIKAVGGMAMAQNLDSAKYPGMPSSAISTNLVDFILAPGELPAQLIKYVKALHHGRGNREVGTEKVSPDPMQRVLVLVRSRTGHDFSAYKTATIERRIERRMNVHQFESPVRYLRYLQENPHELDILFNELLINVTSFFRNPTAFDALAKILERQVLEPKPDDSTFRVWVPACGSGEEAYSIAILLRECMARLNKRLNVQVFGTDLDSQAIGTARAGVYPAGIAADVEAGRLKRFFVLEDNGYRVIQEIREMVVFATQNVLQDPPFTKLDVLSCRNLLIYLQSDLQHRVVAGFHHALKPGGLLFLGPSETTGTGAELFRPVDKKWKIFNRIETATAPGPPARYSAELRPVESPTGEEPRSARPVRQAHLGKAIERTLLNRFAPPTVVIDGRGDIVYIHGRTGAYLEPAAGQSRLNVLQMAREGLRVELATAVRRAASKEAEVTLPHVRIKANGEYVLADVSVVKLAEPDTVRGLFMVTFRPVDTAGSTRATARKPRIRTELRQVDALQRELEYTKETLQAAVQELEIANEELNSTNEELESTNEELETSKEEMQSLNEELATVNAELQTKVEELSRSNNDLHNLLNSTDIATIFLDTGLKIKRFTAQAKRLIHVIDSDVGRPIADLRSNLEYNTLADDAEQVLADLVLKEKELRTIDDAWCLMRIMPYRTADNVIDGVVVSFVDITRIKQSERAREEAHEMAESIVATVREPLLVMDESLTVVQANGAFYKAFRMTPQQVENEVVFGIGHGEWNISALRTLLEEILPSNTTMEDFVVEHTFAALGYRKMILNARRLIRGAGKPAMILLAIEDVTDRDGMERRR